MDGSEASRPGEPVGRLGGTEEVRVAARSTIMATGTLACPSCDAPVAPPGPLSPADPIGCGFCGHAGVVREFLSLASPSRPAHVVVRVVAGGRGVRIQKR